MSNEPWSKFHYHLCKVYQTTPDDPKITEMDSVQKMWMFQHWIAEQKDLAELAKNHALFIASFDHGDSVRKIIEGPDHMSTDEEFEETSRMVREAIEKDNIKRKEQGKRKRNKRKIKG